MASIKFGETAGISRIYIGDLKASLASWDPLFMHHAFSLKNVFYLIINSYRKEYKACAWGRRETPGAPSFSVGML